MQQDSNVLLDYTLTQQVNVLWTSLSVHPMGTVYQMTWGAMVSTIAWMKVMKAGVLCKLIEYYLNNLLGYLHLIADLTKTGEKLR